MPSTARVWSCRVGSGVVCASVSKNHAITCPSAPASGATTSYAGPIWWPMALQYRRVTRMSSLRDSSPALTFTPPNAPPNGMRTSDARSVASSAWPLTVSS